MGEVVWPAKKRPWTMTVAVIWMQVAAALACVFLVQRLMAIDALVYGSPPSEAAQISSELAKIIPSAIMGYLAEVLLPLLLSVLIGCGQIWPRYAYFLLAAVDACAASWGTKLSVVTLLTLVFLYAPVILLLMPTSRHWSHVPLPVVGAKLKKPRLVQFIFMVTALAILFAAAGGIMAIYGPSADGVVLPSSKSASLYLAAAIMGNAGIGLVLLRFMLIRRNWARYGLLLIMLSWAMFVVAFFNFPEPVESVGFIAMLASLVLLLLPETTRWFKAYSA